jgi:hypothetical protein
MIQIPNRALQAPMTKQRLHVSHIPSRLVKIHGGCTPEVMRRDPVGNAYLLAEFPKASPEMAVIGDDRFDHAPVQCRVLPPQLPNEWDLRVTEAKHPLDFLRDRQS